MFYRTEPSIFTGLRPWSNGTWYSMIVGDSWVCAPVWPSAIMHYRQLSFTSNLFKFSMIVDDILVPRGRDRFGQHQESWPLVDPNFWTCAKYLFCNFKPIRFVRSDDEAVNRELPVLAAARGHDSWCWPKGSQPLGTRMSWWLLSRLTTHMAVYNSPGLYGTLVLL